MSVLDVIEQVCNNLRLATCILLQHNMCMVLLPARTSKQGNVIGLVSMSSKKNCN